MFSASPTVARVRVPFRQAALSTGVLGYLLGRLLMQSLRLYLARRLLKGAPSKKATGRHFDTYWRET